MVNFCFIQPPSSLLLEDKVMPPLGILYLSAWLRKHGHEVSIVDLAGVEDWQEHLFIENYKIHLADIIGFTATTPQYNISKEIRDYIKERYEPRAKFVIGGIHTTSLAYANEMEFLEKDGFDSYCIGEGYNAVLRMAEDFPNLKRMYSEPILKDVNELPFAARDLIDIKSYKYKLGDTPTATFYTQYGCYYECSYCVHPSSHIITSDGMKKITEVNIGDLVLTHKGRFRRIVNKFEKQYDGDIVTVKTKGGSDEEFQTSTTVDHEYFTRHLGYGTISTNNKNARLLTHFGKVRAENLKIGQIHRASEYIIFPRIKEIKDLEQIFTSVEFFNTTTLVNYPVNYDLMKVIGYYLAEGSIRVSSKRGTHAVVFSFGKSEKEERYAMELIDALNKLGIKSLLGNYSGWRVSVDSVKFARFIENNFGRYSFKKHIPLWMKLLPPEKLDVMFNCYINGDGHRYKKIVKFQRIVARTVSKQLALDMRDISLKLGYTCGIVTHTNKPIIQGRNVNIHKTYVCAFTPSERNAIRNDNEYMYLAVKDIIRSKYNGPVYDIEVEEDHSYCTPLHCISNCESKMAGSYVVRAMNPQRIQDELRHVRDTYGIHGAMFFDDELNLDKKRMLAICAKIKELGDIVWRGFMVTAKFDKEIAEACKESNCYEVASGIESGSPTILKNIKKPATLDLNRKFLVTGKKAGLRTKAFMIIGLPGESWQTIKESYTFIKSLGEYQPDDVDFSILQVYKGSGIYKNPMDVEFEDYDSDKMYYKSSPDSYTDLIQVQTKAMTKYDLVAARNFMEATFKKQDWIKDYSDRKDLDEVYKQDKILESIKYAKKKLEIQD